MHVGTGCWGLGFSLIPVGVCVFIFVDSFDSLLAYICHVIVSHVMLCLLVFIIIIINNNSVINARYIGQGNSLP